MNSSEDNILRALIRLLPPAKRLKDDLERSIHLEIYAGTGDLAIRSVNGLQASAAALTNDPYLAALALTASSTASDKEKVSLALLAASQLAAYLEGQTGLINLGGDHSGDITYATAPQIQIYGNSGVPAETINRMIAVGEQALEGKGDGNG
jgi:hypothetical protein